MSLSDKAFSSSIIIILAKWTQRLFGIISILVLARLLQPADFGIVAMSVIVVRFFEVLVQTGPQQFLLSRKHLDNDALDTAWTLNLLSKLCVALTVFLLADVIAHVFNEPRLGAVLRVCALIPILDGLQSTGQYLLERNFNYLPLAKSIIAAKFASFSLTMTIAWTTESYWAMVLGDIAYSAVFAVCTYLVCEYRPKFRLAGIISQFNFSKWIVFKSILGYTRAKMDQFIISASYDAKTMGLYNVSKEFSMLPYNQITEPLVSVFMSSINEAKGNIKKTVDVYTKIISVELVIVTPIVVGLMCISREFTLVVLGEKWAKAESLIFVMAALNFTYALTSATSATLMALEKVKTVFWLDCVTFVMVAIILLFIRALPIEQFAAYRTALGAVIFVLFFITLNRIIPVGLARIARAFSPCLLSVLLMAWVLINLEPWIAEWAIFWQFVLKIVIGACVYSVSMLVFVFLLSKHLTELHFLRTLIKTQLMNRFREKIGY